MNICVFKKQADDETIYEKEIEEIQNQATCEFEKFLEIMERSDLMWNEKMKISVDTFVSDLKEYFKQNGFNVTRDIPEDYYTITVTYKNKNMYFYSINYDGQKSSFCYQQHKGINFKFSIPSNCPDYLCCQEFNIRGEKLSDYVREGCTVKDCYKDYIHKFKTKDELQELIEEISIRIKHFNDSIENIDKISLCIYRCDTEKNYKDFAEFINSVDLAGK